MDRLEGVHLGFYPSPGRGAPCTSSTSRIGRSTCIASGVTGTSEPHIGRGAWSKKRIGAPFMKCIIMASYFYGTYNISIFPFITRYNITIK